MWSLVLVTLATARAEEPTATLGVSLAGEALQDPWIVAGYRAQGLGGAITASMSMPFHLRARLEIAYHRRGGVTTTDDMSPVSSSWIQYVPISAPVLYEADVGPLVLAAGLGPSYTFFAEPADLEHEWLGSTWKHGVVFRAEGRLHTGLVQPSRVSGRGPRDVDFVVSAGYRKAFRHVLAPASTEGLDLSGVTLGAGLELVY